MPSENGLITVDELIATLTDMKSGDLSIRLSHYDMAAGINVYTARKHVITDEEGEIVDAYVVLNG